MVLTGLASSAQAGEIATRAKTAKATKVLYIQNLLVRGDRN
jgi:hypothetical protein